MEKVQHISEQEGGALFLSNMNGTGETQWREITSFEVLSVGKKQS